MTTQELKNKIEKVLGNSIRCLLPSYWWKNLFHSVADRIDEVETTVSDMVVKSLREFESKHPDIASRTLVYTEDVNSAEAGKNSDMLHKWVLDMAYSTAGTKINPLYIAVPLAREFEGYCILSPIYRFNSSKKAVEFLDVPMVDGQRYNISFSILANGEATRELVRSENLITFVAPIDGTLTEEAKQNNIDSYTTLKESYKLFLLTKIPAYNVSVLYDTASCFAQIVTPPTTTTSGIEILFTDPDGFRQKLIVKSDGSATMKEFTSESESEDAISVHFSYFVNGLSSSALKDNQDNYLRLVKYGGYKDIKIQYLESNIASEVKYLTVNSVETGQSGIILKVDSMGDFEVVEDGNISFFPKIEIKLDIQFLFDFIHYFAMGGVFSESAYNNSIKSLVAAKYGDDKANELGDAIASAITHNKGEYERFMSFARGANRNVIAQAYVTGASLNKVLLPDSQIGVILSADVGYAIEENIEDLKLIPHRNKDEAFGLDYLKLNSDGTIQIGGCYTRLIYVPIEGTLDSYSEKYRENNLYFAYLFNLNGDGKLHNVIFEHIFRTVNGVIKSNKYASLVAWTKDNNMSHGYIIDDEGIKLIKISLEDGSTTVTTLTQWVLPESDDV